MVCEKVLCERWRVTKRGRRRRRDGGGTAEAGRRRDGGGTEAASTKSQTRTPHKDVGQNMLVIALEIKSVWSSKHVHIVSRWWWMWRRFLDRNLGTCYATLLHLSPQSPLCFPATGLEPLLRSSWLATGQHENKVVVIPFPGRWSLQDLCRAAWQTALAALCPRPRPWEVGQLPGALATPSTSMRGSQRICTWLEVAVAPELTAGSYQIYTWVTRELSLMTCRSTDSNNQAACLGDNSYNFINSFVHDTTWVSPKPSNLVFQVLQVNQRWSKCVHCFLLDLVHRNDRSEKAWMRHPMHCCFSSSVYCSMNHVWKHRPSCDEKKQTQIAISEEVDK